MTPRCRLYFDGYLTKTARTISFKFSVVINNQLNFILNVFGKNRWSHFFENAFQLNSAFLIYKFSKQSE